MLKKAKLVATVVLAAGTVASAQSLTTGDPNNGSGGVWMDLTPNSPLEITQFDIAYTGTTGTMVDVEVWIRPGSYVGNNTSSAGWTLTQTVTGTRQGTATLSPLILNLPVELPAGTTTAVYLQALESGGIRYNGNSLNPPQTTWQNADLTLYSEHSTTASVAFGGSIFTPRTFAGTIHYQPGGPPVPGACCFNDGSCQELLGSECFNQGGTFRGGGTDCATANCPQPAACCFDDGSCQVLLEAACDNEGGTFNAGAATCAAANCPQPGACCVPAGCIEMLEAACTAASGEFRGAGTECATANCPPATQVMMPIPPFDRTFQSATLTRGLWFTAPADFVITGLRVPDETNSGLQNVEVVRIHAEPPMWISTTNELTSLSRHIGEPSQDIIPVNIPVTTGDIIGVLGACGDASMLYNSYAAVDSYQSDILGIPVMLRRLGMQSNIVTSPTQGLFTENAALTRVEVYYSEGTQPCYANCDGSTTEPVLTVDDFTCFINEFAQAQTLPVAQQIEHYANCDGSTTEPILTVDDFTCFINAFAQGCP